MPRQLFILVGKVGLTLVSSSLMGVGLLMILANSPLFEGMFMKISLAAAMGLTSGVLARFILLRNTLMLRWLTAILSLCTGLLLVNVISSGGVGFNPLENFMMSVNWNGLWQLLLGSFISFVAIFAWQRPARANVTPDVSEPEPGGMDDLALGPELLSPQQQVVIPLEQRQPIVKNTTRRSRKTSLGTRTAVAHTNLTGTGRSRAHTTHSVTTERNASTAVSALSVASPALKLDSPRTAGSHALKVPRARRKQISRPARGKTHSQRLRSRACSAPIRLVGKEEHRCPYCLEEVDPKDPNGVVICSVCHTYHHKSCWDITGTCQVPHLTRL